MKKVFLSFLCLATLSAFAQDDAQDISSTHAAEPSIAVEDVTYDMLNSASENTIELHKTNPKSKLIQKADYYFDKMWYAEAAAMYEEALNKDENNYTEEILQRAADANYYNSNMESAYKWYSILYDNDKEEMSANNLFKYSHSLKGIEKYGKAKRLMRLYKKKFAEEQGIADPESYKKTEAELDKILASKDGFSIKNLPINSKYADFGAVFYNDSSVVFASSRDSSFFKTRQYKWNDEPYLDLYAAKFNKESQDLKDAVRFSKKINTKYHEAAVAFSPDNNTMYFTRNNFGKKLRRDRNGINHLKIYMSKKVNGEWTEATELPFNSDIYSTGHPALSPDGKQLYFVSDMPGTMGDTDIFVVDIYDNGTFSDPKNLGPKINTEGKEMFPFITNNGFYFSSDGHTGLGGLDVFKASYSEEEGFHSVENVGVPLNSNKDDFSYIVDEETQKGFFASNRAGGKGGDDIYSFKVLLPEETQHNAIAGVVTELVTEEVMPKALVMLLDENNIKLKEIETAEDGSFLFEDLEGDKKYTLKVQKDNFFEGTQDVTTIVNQTVQADVSLKKLKELITVEEGIKKLKTEMIYFNFDKFGIREDAAKELDKLVDVMNEYEDMVIKIESHTDSRGSDAYNKYLSDKRAKSSRDYLISKGIDAARIESAIGYGEERLLNECSNGVACSNESHELNRRSEFIIVKM